MATGESTANIDQRGAETAICRVCGKAAAFAFAVRGQNLFRCAGCGYLEVSPIPSQAELEQKFKELLTDCVFDGHWCRNVSSQR